MTVLFYLLDRAAGRTELPTTDVEADVARGIRALRRRRAGAAGGFLAVGVAAAAVPGVLSPGSTRGLSQVPPGGSTTAAATSQPGLQRSTCDDGKVSYRHGGEVTTWTCTVAGPSANFSFPALSPSASLGTSTEVYTEAGSSPVPLVGYSGPAAGSYRVALVPQHWVVQGGNAQVIAIGRPGDPDTDPIDFQGKVVAMLSTQDQVPGHAHATPGAVFVDVQGATASLYLRLSGATHGGTWLIVQYPTSLRWTDAVAEKFARGVSVLPSATPGLG